jgi:hypothetical protein
MIEEANLQSRVVAPPAQGDLTADHDARPGLEARVDAQVRGGGTLT